MIPNILAIIAGISLGNAVFHFGMSIVFHGKRVEELGLFYNALMCFILAEIAIHIIGG